MSDPNPKRRSKLSLAFSRAVPSALGNLRISSSGSGSLNTPFADQSSSPRTPHRSTSPDSSLDHNQSSTNHGIPETVSYPDNDLLPPSLPFGGKGMRSSLSNDSSRRSSLATGIPESKSRPQSLSVNYVPAKFTKLHAPGEYSRKRAKTGGGRDAFASNASRMGSMGLVDDDEGIVFQLGKGGLKRKDGKPKLRWNRFKWVLFGANTVLFSYGLATLVSAILVWLNVFYQADVIRVGNRSELIISTIAAVLITLTSLIGYSGILLNNRAFLAVYTLLLWVSLGIMVAPGYMTYKQRTFNLEGKINSQWSRNLGTQGRLRIQDALKCCGYFSPYVEATVSPLCYSRSNLPGCKARYLRLERHVLEVWYAVTFSLVPVHILIILAALLCSNHITYRFGKGLTPKRYRLDLGSMAVIMDEYASQIAAQYGPSVAAQAVNRSSMALNVFADPTEQNPLTRGASRTSSVGSTNGYSPALTKTTSRLAKSSTTPSDSMGRTVSTASSIAGSSSSGNGNSLTLPPPISTHRPSGLGLGENRNPKRDSSGSAPLTGYSDYPSEKSPRFEDDSTDGSGGWAL